MLRASQALLCGRMSFGNERIQVHLKRLYTMKVELWIINVLLICSYMQVSLLGGYFINIPIF